MATTIPTNPYVTSNAAGLFSAATDGWVQGMARDDPSARFALAGGLLSQSETLPMWGGVAIFEQVPTPGAALPQPALGSIVGRATTVDPTSATGVAGFSVFNQNYAAIIDPGAANVPLSASGMEVNYFRLGSGIRIPVQADPSLVSLEGGAIGAHVSWDFINQRLQPYDASTATIAASTTVTWANTAGGQIAFPVTNWTGAFQPVAGDVLAITGATNSGTGGAAAVNKSFTVVSATSTGVVLAAPAGAGVIATIGGSPVINFGAGALPVKVLRVSTSGNMVVNWNGSVAVWNYSGPAAEILL